MDKILIAPSILSADFANLQREVENVIQAGADWIHVDVMDGHFVPNLTIGAPVVSSLSKIENAFLDVHLMIENPEKWIGDYISAGADSITFHYEAAANPENCIKIIKEAGLKAGISLKPSSPIDLIKDLLPSLDLVLIMTVEPGFGGQSFMHDQMSKLQQLKDWEMEYNLNLVLQVDGGINEDTIKIAKAAGANCFVAGSYIFKGNYLNQISKLKNA